MKRSFYKITTISKEQIGNILRAYAVYNKEVGYCQGMNYIAGFILFITKDETNAFAILAGIIEKFELNKVYGSNMELLRSKFYQMDRLMRIYLPNLFEYLRFENVTPTLYMTGWIITLFGITLDDANLNIDGEERPPNILIEIWDHFIASGWKSIFKASIFILKKLENKLFETKFEKIIRIIKNIGIDKLWMEESFAIDFREEFKKIKITNTMLETFETEFKNIMKK